MDQKTQDQYEEASVRWNGFKKEGDVWVSLQLLEAKVWKWGKAMLDGHRQLCVLDRDIRFLQRHCRRRRDKIWDKWVFKGRFQATTNRRK